MYKVKRKLKYEYRSYKIKNFLIFYTIDENKKLITIVRVLYQKVNIDNILEYINVLLLKMSKKNIRYIQAIKIVENTKKRLKANSNYDMCIDNMLFNIWEEVNEKNYRSQI